MANNYKFKGVALATTNETALLTAASTETLIIKSIRVTNNTSNTPTLSFDFSDSSASAEYTILKTQTFYMKEEYLGQKLLTAYHCQYIKDVDGNLQKKIKQKEKN